MKTTFRELDAQTLRASASEAIFAINNVSTLMQSWMSHTGNESDALILKMVQEKPKRLVTAPPGRLYGERPNPIGES
jgi:hypothetical protein